MARELPCLTGGRRGVDILLSREEIEDDQDRA